MSKRDETERFQVPMLKLGSKIGASVVLKIEKSGVTVRTPDAGRLEKISLKEVEHLLTFE